MATVDVARISHSVKITWLLENQPALSTSKISGSQDPAALRLDSTSTPPVTLGASWEPTLVAGTLDIDLTALPGPQGNFTAAGKKVQLFRLQNSGDNSVTVAPGAANGYELFGTSKSVVVPAGAILLMVFDDTLADVDGTHKIITLTGTTTDAFDCDILLG